MGFWTRVRLPPTPLKAPIRLPGMGDQVGVFKYMINPKVTEDNMNTNNAIKINDNVWSFISGILLILIGLLKFL